MKIVIAMDSFKGSLSASEAVASASRGVRSVFPDAQIVPFPLGDGGEGTLDALHAADPASEFRSANAHGPLGESVTAQYLLSGPFKKRAAVEIALACGLTMIRAENPSPLRVSSFGVGELILSAASAPDIDELIVCLGGSACNDGGAGALQALGIEFLNAKTQPFERPITGSDLENISDFRIAFEPQIPRRLNVTLACDVDNPLCGPNGASMVFGPQKGADQETAKQLDIAMAAYAPLLDRIALTRGGKAADSPIAEIPGSGAAGGLSAALMAFFPESQIRPGIDIALDDGRFGQKAQDADLILVGEGRLDSQTLSGKAIEGVLRRVTTALGKKPPVISFSGLVDPEAANDLKARGLDAAYGISEISDSLEESMANAEELLERLVRERLKDWNPLPDR